MDTPERRRKTGRSWKFSLDFLETHEGTARLEAFSDAIFAIAATLLVIDIKVPPGLHTPDRLLDALIRLWPNYLGYAISFLYLGVYWSHHFHLFSLFRRTDHIFLKVNAIFLMLISFLPFPTALLSEYLLAPVETQRIAVLAYTASLALTGAMFFIIWLYAKHGRRLIDADLDTEVIRYNTRRYALAPLGYTVSFLSTFWSVNAGLGIATAVTLYYLIPFQVFRFD
ncbi:MAG: potassium channel family protein [Burkholderiales bacterium]